MIWRASLPEAPYRCKQMNQKPVRQTNNDGRPSQARPFLNVISRANAPSSLSSWLPAAFASQLFLREAPTNLKLFRKTAIYLEVHTLSPTTR